MLECRDHPHNYFITLTYDDDHLPSDPDVEGYIDYSGEVFSSSLCLKDFQDFMKRLRDGFDRDFNHTGIRIAYCGEYGELTSRPHYHLILMNSPDFSDYLQFLRCKTVTGERVNYYKCPYIFNKWGKGIIEVTDVSFNTAAYVAGYVQKKQYKRDFVRQVIPEGFAERVQPFFHVSNRPGLARRYFDENFSEIYSNDELFVKKRFEVMKVKPPRYFDKLYDVLDPVSMQSIKESREKDVLRKTDLSDLDYLAAHGERLARKQKQMKGRNIDL